MTIKEGLGDFEISLQGRMEINQSVQTECLEEKRFANVIQQNFYKI